MLASPLFAGVERVVCLGAHPDDIEIGCGATLARLRRLHPSVEVRFVVLTGTGPRRTEAEASAGRLLGDIDRLTLHDFHDGYLPYDEPAAVKEALLMHRGSFQPDVVFAPRRGDAHQDHRFVGELTWQIYRRQVILHYEIAKYEQDLGAPNVYVALDESDVTAKLAHLEESFPSEVDKPWFDSELFRGLMRMRGVECAAASGYAEAFEAPKLVLS